MTQSNNMFLHGDQQATDQLVIVGFVLAGGQTGVY
jgi:hypothetical protein